MVNVIDDITMFYDFIGKFTEDIDYIQLKKMISRNLNSTT